MGEVRVQVGLWHPLIYDLKKQISQYAPKIQIKFHIKFHTLPPLGVYIVCVCYCGPNELDDNSTCDILSLSK